MSEFEARGGAHDADVEPNTGDGSMPLSAWRGVVAEAGTTLCEGCHGHDEGDGSLCPTCDGEHFVPDVDLQELLRRAVARGLRIASEQAAGAASGGFPPGVGPDAEHAMRSAYDACAVYTEQLADATEAGDVDA